MRNLLNVIVLTLGAFFSFLLLGIDTAAAQTTAAPAKVQVGAYVMRLSNVSQKDGTFDVDMWLWFRWTDPNIRPYDSFEISNGRIENKSDATVTRDGNFNYTSVRVQATVFHDYDVQDFPMDDHNLIISLEDKDSDISKIVYESDDQTEMDPNLQVPGWGVALGEENVVENIYPTNYGLSSSGTDSAVYSRVNFSVILTRESYGPLFKQFWMTGLSVLLGLMAFRVKATDLDARFGLGVGSIFAASANAFVVAGSLPESTVITLAEKINFLAIGTISLCVAISIWSLRICYQNKDELSARLDYWAMTIIGSLYILANVVIVMWHL